MGSVSYRVPSDDDISDDDATSAPAAGGHPAVATRPYAVEEQRDLVEQQLLLSLEVGGAVPLEAAAGGRPAPGTGDAPRVDRLCVRTAIGRA